MAGVFPHVQEAGPDQGAAQGGLRRVLGLPFALLVVVGGSIGSGILRAPGPVAAAIPDPAVMLAVWLAGGVLTWMEALPLMELAAALPCAGGPTVYVERAFGRQWGALVGWSSWLQCTVSLALLAVVAGEFAVRLGFQAPVPVIAIGLIVVLTALNVADARANARNQAVVQVVKLGGIVALTALIFAVPSHRASADPTQVTTGGLVLAAMLVYNTYQGWGSVVAFGEELRAPVRTLARALFGGIALLVLIYSAMVVALLHALPVATIAGSTLPAADATARIAGPAADRIITAISLLSVVSLANLTIMVGARILVAMARSGAMPVVLARVERNGAPAAATLVGGAAAALLASIGAYLALNALYAPLAIFTAVAVLLAAARLRRTAPELERPWRMPAYPAPILIALAVNLALFVAISTTAPRGVLGALALLGLAAIIPLSDRR